MVQAGFSAFCSAAGGTNLVIAEFIAGATRGFYLQKMTVMQSDANVGTYYLRRTLTLGVTPTLGAPFPYRSTNDTVQARVAVAWGTRPLAATGPVAALVSLPATIGASVSFDFTTPSNRNGEGLGIFVAPATSLSIFSPLATGAPYITCQILEM